MDFIVEFIKRRSSLSAFAGLPLTLLVLAAGYIIILLVGLTEDILNSDAIAQADVRIENLFFAYRAPALVKVFLWITLLGKFHIIMAAAAAVCLMAWMWRRREYIIALFTATAGSFFFVWLGKNIVRRPRPAGVAVYEELSLSFPSGHAAIAVAFWGCLLYILLRQKISWKMKVSGFFAGIIIILGIGLSRLYLGVHFLSDVLGGYAVGLLWLFVGISFAEVLKKYLADPRGEPMKRAGIFSVILILGFAIFYAWYGMRYSPQRNFSRTAAVVARRVSLAGDAFFTDG